ncbi:multiple sugar transport system permease protein [Paenibacillus sp. V4I3]|uniref:carbohydrate ABC transporter permease n=1 Tax=Paenibacillus sp. V4I3 TaxID=3042305 RepID=UPI0027879BFF|nr:sugar ABC transporter permease [Paenibacillus sp. V4I3]MDQ0878550.1 multiple sugar transport system permease protein [Paenibacillus sp. V4I3]
MPALLYPKMVITVENMDIRETIENRTYPGRKSLFGRERKTRLIANLFVLPALVFFLLLIAYPLITVIWDSFHFKNLVNKTIHGFAGWDNYKEVIQHENFWSSLRYTVVWTVLSVIGEYLLGIISAVSLNQPLKGRAIFRGIIIIPWVVPIVVAGLTWQWMLAPDYGIMNIWMVKLGIIDKPYYWLGEINTALLTVTFVNIWRSFPFYTISLLAGLQSVSKEMIEAAAIDGAGVTKRFFNIVLPQLKSVSLVLVFVHIIWTAINFDFIWVMTEGGPFNSTETLPVMIYRYAMKEYDVGAASALASMMLGFMMVAFLLLYVRSAKKNSLK